MTSSPSRWGRAVGNGSAGTTNATTAGADVLPSASFNRHVSIGSSAPSSDGDLDQMANDANNDFSSSGAAGGGDGSTTNGALTAIDYYLRPKLPHNVDFEYSTEVEWGPRPGEDGYDTDQELEPRPYPESRSDPCGCQAPFLREQNGEQCYSCLDDSCINFAIQEECRSNCLAGDACGNRRIQRKQFKPIEVFEAGQKGYGLRILSSAKKGDMIGEYTGRAVKDTHLMKLFKRYKCERRLYIMALSPGVVLDARNKGGLIRFINHSCEPNCKVDRWKVRGIQRAVVIATKDLQEGEELTFDYQWVRQKGRAPTVCYCGTPTCRGTLEVPKSLEDEEAERELMEGHWKKMPSTTKPDVTIVNRTVQVFSVQQQKNFLGEVSGYDAQKGLHCILYRHDWKEVWEDLSVKEWMILDESVDNDEGFVIAKKESRRRSSTGSLLQTTCTVVPLAAVSSLPAGVSHKNYLYVQTPIKEAIWAKRIVEHCERSCNVKVEACQFAKPPLQLDPNDQEQVEKYQALDQSLDGTVWKLSITGSNVGKALAFLQKNAAHLQSKMAFEAQQQHQAANLAATADAPPRSLAANSSPSVNDAHEVIFPQLIEDELKRKLPVLQQQRCRNVTIRFLASENNNKQSSRLAIEGSLLSDINTAKECLWKLLGDLCDEVNAPMKENKLQRNCGFLGGALSSDHFKLLCCNTTSPELSSSEIDNLNRSSFLQSFESACQCAVWVQANDDESRTNSSCHDAPKKLFFRCEPQEVDKLWETVRQRAAELAQGNVKYLHLGADWLRYRPLITKNEEELFKYVKSVTGAVVTVDPVTGDHLRIEKNPQDFLIHNFDNKISEEQRLDLAEEIVRLQIEFYRDHCIREQNWTFGRDWTLAAKSVGLPLIVNNTSENPTKPPLSSSASFSTRGPLDKNNVSCGAMEIAEVVEALKIPRNVAAHACLILYRFVHVKDRFETQIKAREAVFACTFLAIKAQKIKKRKLSDVLEAGFRLFYSVTQFDPNNEEVLVLGEKVIVAESEILKSLDYDVFWYDVKWISNAATGAGKMTSKFVQKAFDFAFNGSVFGAGAELWLKYGVEYVFAVAVAFLQPEMLVGLFPALSLIPLKVKEAADLLVASLKLGRRGSKKMSSHFLLQNGSHSLEKRLPRIQEICVQSMFSPSPQVLGSTSSVEQRYKIIGSRSQQRFKIINVDEGLVKDQILPVLENIVAESTCNISITESCPGSKGFEDIVLEGSWRAIAMADHLIRASVVDKYLQQSVDASKELGKGVQLQAKELPGFLEIATIQTAGGWDGTIQSEVSSQANGGRKAGGKGSVPGKIEELSLRESGLRWWIPPKHGPSTTGSISNMFIVRCSPSDQLGVLGKLADSLVGQSTRFPILTSRKVTKEEDVDVNRSVAISLQRWPSEKISVKEMDKSKSKGMQIGFSPAALQEMQLLTELHTLIPSPQGHPNFLLPVGIAISDGVESKSTANAPPTEQSKDDNFLSLFRSNKEKDRVPEKSEQLKDCPHIVFQPTPFVLEKFKSSKKNAVSPTILAAWFHDILSALVHCHSNHVILRTILPDSIMIDHSGVLKFGGLYRSKMLSDEERLRPPPDYLQIAKKEQKRKRKKDRNRDNHGEKESDNDPMTDTNAAPEILLGSPEHTKESDVWAVGSILANILLGKPLFQGKRRLLLLTSQYKVVGYPRKDNFEEGAEFPLYTKPEKKYKRGVEKALNIMSKDSSQHAKAIDLISRMLHLDPNKRCTAAEALGHDFMNDYIENCGSGAFRRQFVSEWMELKQSSLKSDSKRDAKEKERELKRKAKLLAASNASDDDDLYDIDDILDNSAKKTRY